MLAIKRATQSLVAVNLSKPFASSAVARSLLMASTRNYSIIDRLHSHPASKLALVDAVGSQNYGQLRAAALSLSTQLRGLKSPDGKQPRVAVFAPKDRTWLHGMVAAWYAGAIAVPLAEAYPPAELHYALESSGASAVIVNSKMEAAIAGAAKQLDITLIPVTTTANANAATDADYSDPVAADCGVGSNSPPLIHSGQPSDGAYIIYTSGTTGALLLLRLQDLHYAR